MQERHFGPPPVVDRFTGSRAIPAAARAAAEALDHPNDAQVENIRCQRFLGGLLRHYFRDAA